MNNVLYQKIICDLTGFKILNLGLLEFDVIHFFYEGYKEENREDNLLTR